jgi:hypothetical protein
MGRYITALLCHLACASALAAEPTTAVGQDTVQRVAAAGPLSQNGQEVLGRDVVLPRYVRTRSIRNVAPGVRVERGAQAQPVAA